MKKHAGRSVDFVDSVDLVQIFEFKASKWQNQAINAKWKIYDDCSERFITQLDLWWLSMFLALEYDEQ